MGRTSDSFLIFGLELGLTALWIIFGGTLVMMLVSALVYAKLDDCRPASDVTLMVWKALISVFAILVVSSAIALLTILNGWGYLVVLVVIVTLGLVLGRFVRWVINGD